MVADETDEMSWTTLITTRKNLFVKPLWILCGVPETVIPLYSYNTSLVIQL